MPRHPGEHRSRTGDRSLRRPPGATSSICGLVGYQQRSGAKWAARNMPFFQNQHARAYPCHEGCGQWHAGYLPELVVQGVVTAGEWYGSTGQKPMRDVLIPLLEKVRRRTHGELSFERRRVVPADGDEFDLWSAMINARGVLHLARDYDNPNEATAAALEEYAAALTETEPAAA